MGGIHKLKAVVNEEIFLVAVLYPKGGRIFWIRVEDSIIVEKEYYIEIGLCGFDYKLFE